jgi:hypothetical protein
MPQICVICQYVVVLSPLGLHIQTCRFLLSSKEPGVGSRAYIPTSLPMALDEDGGSFLLCFMLCTRKVKDLCNLDLRYNFDTIAMITIFCTMVLSTDPGNGTDTQEFCL